MALVIPASASVTRRTCRECRFHGVEGADVVCRRHPPQVTVLLVPASPPRVGMAPQPFATFPPVQPEHPCGEFQPASAA